MAQRLPYFYLLFISLLAVGITSCNEIDPKNENDVRDFLNEWNQRHTPIKATNLKHDYMDVVTYYGTELTKEQVQQHKNKLFDNFPSYRQQIVESSVQIERDGPDYLVSFTRSISFDGEAVSVPSFLNVSAKNSSFRILQEGLQQGANTPELNSLFPSKTELESNFGERRKLYGDFNGDATSDYAWVAVPTASDCSNGCDRTVQFSNPEIRPWLVEQVYITNLENLSDLNGDGADEIGLWSKQPQAETLYIYDANNSRLLTPPVTINTRMHKNLKLIDVIKKTGPKKITVTESMEENGSWVLKSRVVVLQ